MLLRNCNNLLVQPPVKPKKKKKKKNDTQERGEYLPTSSVLFEAIFPFGAVDNYQEFKYYGNQLKGQFIAYQQTTKPRKEKLSIFPFFLAE